VVIAETFVKREFQADPALFCPYVGSTPARVCGFRLKAALKKFIPQLKVD